MRAGSGELNFHRMTGEASRLQLQFQRDQARQQISLAGEWGERKVASFHVFLTGNRIRLRMFVRT
jgi:hypothetical protein